MSGAGKGPRGSVCLCEFSLSLGVWLLNFILYFFGNILMYLKMLLLTNYLIILVVESVLFAILIYLFYNLFNFIYLCKPFFGNKTRIKKS